MNLRPLTSVLPLFLLTALPAVAALDTARIDAITGLKGVWNEGEKVHKVSQPRSDLPVTVDGWSMPPFMGLTSWASFTEGGKAEAMVAGDLVLFEDEVNPVMTAALEAGLSVTALHNHFFFEQPRVYFMHVGGEGTVAVLAAGVKAALAKQKEIRAVQPQPARTFGAAFMPDVQAVVQLGRKFSLTIEKLRYSSQSAFTDTSVMSNASRYTSSSPEAHGPKPVPASRSLIVRPSSVPDGTVS